MSGPTTSAVVDAHAPLASVGLVCVCGKALASMENVARTCECGRVWLISVSLLAGEPG